MLTPVSDKAAPALEPIVGRWGGNPLYLFQMLREAQAALGHLSAETMDFFATALRVPRVRVESVATFYSFLSTRPRGEYTVLFSDNITDRMLGNRDLMQYMCERLWVEAGKVSEDGLVCIDATSCTGLCDQGPAALINGMAVSQLDRGRIDLIAELIRSRKPLADWPAMLFETVDNVRRADVLLADFEPGSALKAGLARGVEGILSEMDVSNLRGRGGAGFKTFLKWSSCRGATGDAHYVVCNADEGEPGTFKDRVLLASHADLVFEGMTLAARTIGARKGFLYLRGEYLYLLDKLNADLERRRAAGLLGDDILGEKGFCFDIEIHLGAGAYVCGEESALIESLEGKAGKPRNRPPFPTVSGYDGRPTVLDNVETFACAARIALHGGAWFAAMGTPQSTGTKLISVSGDCARPGIYEYPFGVTVRQILEDCGASATQAVQVSGPSGTCVSWKEFDRKVAFEDLPTAGAFMVFNRSRDMFDVAENFTRFFAHESCGFCTPCRVGTSLMKGMMNKIRAGHGTAHEMSEMAEVGRIMRTTSHCGLGQTAANPVLQTMEKFPDAYERKLQELAFDPSFDLDGALATARRITGRDDSAAHLGTEE